MGANNGYFWVRKIQLQKSSIFSIVFNRKTATYSAFNLKILFRNRVMQECIQGFKSLSLRQKNGAKSFDFSPFFSFKRIYKGFLLRIKIPHENISNLCLFSNNRIVKKSEFE